MDRRVRGVSGLLGALLGLAVALLLGGVHAPPPHWQDEAGPRRGQSSIVSTAESWNVTRSVIALHASPDYPAVDTPYLWSVAAALPADGWLDALLTRAGLTHRVLQVEVTQPSWAVLNAQTGEVLPGDGVLVEFVGVTASGPQLRAQVALQPYTNLADRSWRPVRVELPRAARQVQIRVLTGPPGSTPYCDHVWVHPVGVQSQLGPLSVRSVQLAVHGLALAFVGAWLSRYVPPLWRRAMRVLRAVAVATQPVELWLRAAARGLRPLPVLCLSAWLLLYLPRAWQLGFFLDDWDFIVRWSHESIWRRYELWWGLLPFRPVVSVFMPTLSAILGADPTLWQAALALTCLLISLQLHGVVRRLGTRCERSYSLSADLAAASWLVLPWSMPTTAWVVMLLALVSVSLFLAAARVLLAAGDAWRGWLWAAVLYLLSCLTYESFYLGFGCLLAMWLAGNPVCRAKPRSLLVLLRGAGLFALVQLLAIGYSRAWVYLTPGGITLKRYNPDFMTVAWSSLRQLPAQFLESFHPWEPVVANLCIGLIALITVAVVIALARRQGASVLAIMLLSVGSVSGIIGSVVVYSAAGHSVARYNEVGRSLLAANIYIALLVFVCLRAAKSIGSILPALPAYGVTAVTLALAGLALRTDQDRWARGWALVSSIVRDAPAAEIARLPEDAKIVYVGPVGVDGLYVIGTLQLNLAMFHYHPSTRIPITTGRRGLRDFLVKLPEHIVQWDGSTLSHELPGYWRGSYECSHVFLWTASDQRLVQLSAPTTLGPGWGVESRSQGSASVP